MKMEEKLVHTMDEQCHVRENGQENDNAEEEEEEEEDDDPRPSFLYIQSPDKPPLRLLC